MIVQTKHGALEGAATVNGLVFKGVPFAGAPVGPLRFRPPTAPASWVGVRPALEYGPAAPQPYDEILEQMFGQAPFPTDETACLSLNVWTPAVDGARKPVLVWLHGGGFLTGSGRDLVFDGARFAALHDVVVVTLNYRLGAFGFLYLGEVLGEPYRQSGNLGLLDQVAALEWVRDNIGAFGGDAGNVTVFGQSAGAMSALTLMTMPAANGLLHKVIVQSGNAEYVRQPIDATSVTRELLSLLGIDLVDAQRILDVPTIELLAAQQQLTEAMRSRGGAVGLPFAPVLDGEVLPVIPLNAIRAGAAAGIPLVAGTNREEGRLFLLGSQQPDMGDDALLSLFGSAYRHPDTALATFRKIEPDPTPTGLAAALIGEQMFHAPTDRYVEAQAAVTPQVWRYLFSWRSTAWDGALGACHSLELPFAFDNLDQPGVRKFTGPHPPQHIADRIGAAWAQFAHTARITDWPVFDSQERQTMVFDTSCAIIQDPLNELRGLRPDAVQPAH